MPASSAAWTSGVRPFSWRVSNTPRCRSNRERSIARNVSRIVFPGPPTSCESRRCRTRTGSAPFTGMLSKSDHPAGGRSRDGLDSPSRVLLQQPPARFVEHVLLPLGEREDVVGLRRDVNGEIGPVADQPLAVPLHELRVVLEPE